MIPYELTTLRQWCWSTLATNPLTGKRDKAPRTPITGELASSVDQSTWGTYADALASAEQHGGAVGFVLTEQDPYVVIDLDHDPAKPPDEKVAQGQQLVFKEFAGTYAELSQSGYGCHIVVRAPFVKGLRRPGLEVYGAKRYIIFTGNTLPDRDLPIADMSEHVTELVAALGGADADGDMPDSLPETESDEDILRSLREAANGAKFSDLYDNVPGEHHDWSQRDAALAQFIAYRTRNYEQALRLFRGSRLYNPERKAGKSGYKTVQNYEQGYLIGTTFKKQWQLLASTYYHRDRGREFAAVLVDNERRKQEQQLAAAVQRAEALPPPAANLPVPDNSIPVPPGLLGQVAMYVYDTSPSPVWEIAIAAAITFCSAVFGNKWRTATNNGLGHYVVLLAESGTGKTAAVNRITALVRAVEEQGNALATQLTGPGYVASGQGLLKRFAEQPVMYSFLSEFDATLQRLDPTNASDSYVEFRRVLLEVFDADRISATAYAKKDDSTAKVDYPVFSFMGDTRAEDFFALVTEQFARSGFLPRLTLIEYKGPVMYRPLNYRPHIPAELVSAMSAAVFACSREMSGVLAVPMDNAASLYFDSLGRERVDKINASTDTLTRTAWNRMDLRISRLATVVAVGRNVTNPVVTLEDMHWAEGVVRWGIDRVLGDRVQGEQVGEGEVRFIGDVVEFIQAYHAASPSKRRNLKAPRALEERGDVYPFASFKEFVKWRVRYRDHKQGFARAVEMAISEAVKSGLLDQLKPDQCAALGYPSARVPVFVLGEEAGAYMRPGQVV